MTLEEALLNGSSELGLPPPDTAAFRKYYDLLTEANTVMNLTTVAGEYDTAVLHFLDSVAPLTFAPLSAAPGGASLIDIGSGAGFPGLPIKITRRDFRATLLDAQEKRVGFLRRVVSELGLDDVECIHARAEEPAPERCGVYDYAVSRAVADMRELLELALPYVRVGGYFVAWKSVGTDEEIARADNALRLLGGELAETRDYVILAETPRRIVVVRKTAETPAEYPRKNKKIQTKPL